MAGIKDGGPVFPVNPYFPSLTTGMSLRDYFAGQVLANATLMHWQEWEVGNEYDAARTAYIIADAMLKAREPR
jgi:hypothetical protein